MTELMRTLFTFTLEHNGNAAYLPAYRQATRRVQEKEMVLRQQLGEEHQHLLDEFMSELSEQIFIEQEHIFLGTISVCRELMTNVP